MKKNIPFFFLILLVSCGFSRLNISKQSNEIVFEIHFQDFFKSDTVSFNINGSPILNKTILTSDSSEGFTGIIVKGYNHIEGEYSICSMGNTFFCKKMNTSLNIIIEFNKVHKEFHVDLTKGMYIGFSVVDKSNLQILQSKIPFAYD